MKFFDEEKLEQNKKIVLTLVLVLVFFVVLNRVTTSPVNKNLSPIIVNEIMASNDSAYADLEGNCYDWVELYNSSEEDISLKGYRLSDGNSKNEVILGDVILPSHGYVLFYLTGKESTNPYYLSFALNKSKEEPLILKNEKNEVISMVKVPNIKKNTTYAYHHKKYSETETITPGYANTMSGRLEYLKDRRESDQTVFITEFLVDNQGIYVHDQSLYSYIEITNFGEEAVSLADYFLSNDKERPFLYRLPDVVLEPNTSYLIYPTKKEKIGHANFTLNSKEGEILLSKNGKIVESISYQTTKKGYAFVREANSFIETTNLSPGYPNTLSGRKEAAKKDTNPTDLIINEVMSSNDTLVKEKNGKAYDWIEIKNASKNTISLEGYSLTTNPKSPNRFSLPKRSLKSGETILIMASGGASIKNAKYIHANFKLQEEEGVFLYKGKELIDALYIPPLKVGYSFGRGNSYGHYYFSSPTPNKKNNSGVLEITEEPTFSIAPGVYNNVKEVSVELQGEGDIYYTLDGSVPTKNSKKYTGKISLTKTTVIRAIAYSKEKASSEVVTGSYIVNENHTLPVLSLSLSNTQFQNLNASIHSTKLEYPAHIEFYEKNGSFSINCGLKLFGGQSRELDKKSYALKFSSEYGASSLSYPVFENREILNYNTIVLRSGSQDMEGSMFRDELSDAIVDMAGTVDTQAYKAAVLYINGTYWGVYYLREKIDDVFIGQHYNVSPTGTNIVKIEGEVDEGTRASFNKLMQYVRTHDLSTDSAYQEVSKMLDIDNYIEFIIGQFFANNIDIRNTRYFNNSKVANGKIRMIYYDLDYGLRYGPVNYLTWVVNPEGAGYFNVDNSLIRGLMQNAQFKKHFLEVFFYDMKYIYTDEKVMAKYNEIYNAIAPEMKRNQERWNYSYDTFLTHAKSIKSFLKGRRNRMIANVQSYFNLSDKEVKAYLDDSHYLQDYMKRQSQIVKSSM